MPKTKSKYRYKWLVESDVPEQDWHGIMNTVSIVRLQLNRNLIQRDLETLFNSQNDVWIYAQRARDSELVVHISKANAYKGVPADRIVPLDAQPVLDVLAEYEAFKANHPGCRWDKPSMFLFYEIDADWQDYRLAEA